MFFITYLRRELRRRMRQAVLVALGLAIGIGLVVTVSAASAGVKKAQADVLSSLYGVGTDVTVTGSPPKPPAPGSAPPKNARSIQVTPNGAEECQNGKCHSVAGTTQDNLGSTSYNPISESKVAAVARLKDVRAAAGGLVLTDNRITFPRHFGQPGSPLPTPTSFNVDGADTGNLSLGPLGAGTITAGRSLRASDAHANVAVVDSGYARAGKLKVGSAVTIAGTKFRVVGIVRQPQGGSPPDVYIPLDRAQALAAGPGSGSLKGKINTIYVTADSAADIPAVQKEIARLLPGQCRQAGRCSRQVAVGPGADRGLRGGQPADDGRRLPPGGRVRHAQGPRLELPPDRRSGAGRVGNRGRDRRGAGRGPRLR